MIQMRINKVVLVLLVIGLIGCNKQPIASFEMSTNTPESEQEVVFTNTSENGISYSWNFGDGTTSTEESPKHTYALSGSYDLTYTTFE